MSAVGYGELTPATFNEQCWVLFMMMTSCGLFAYTINSIGNIVSRFNQIVTTYRERMMYVNRFLLDKKMPDDLRMKVRRYLDYVFESKKQIKVDEKIVFKMLSRRGLSPNKV